MTKQYSGLPDKQPAIRVAAMPADANSGGSIFGGWIMSQVDIAGSIAALERARGRVATVAVNSFSTNPILLENRLYWKKSNGNDFPKGWDLWRMILPKQKLKKSC